MDTPSAIQQLQSFDASLSGEISGKQAIRDAVEVALSLLLKGYQSDQRAIADEITKQVGDVRDENENLKNHVDSLLADSDTKDAEIVDLRAYKDTHPEIS